MTKTVGIIGLAGAGKDTFAEYLTTMLDWYGLDCRTYTFASSLRWITQKTGFAIFDRQAKEKVVTLDAQWVDRFQSGINGTLGEFVDNVTRLDLWANTVVALERQGHYNKDGTLTCSPRQFAQLFGTEGGRSIHEDFWVDLLLAKIKKESPAVALIPDTRFINEALKCDVLAVIRNPRVRPVNDHPSEALARKFSSPGGFEHALLHKPIHFIDNSASLNVLKMAAANVSSGLDLEVK